ncbi:hypothetical protein CVT24_003698 [Panaeolus cyanescens]|uniref:Uncharacterized protein n=1 Tax=Panaeolus cyanescens TaxID=181874 RepID=A0A409WC93_9AGAR|nr:hypothetical protein CVT24_003698 [Panaeolus cyanescens]
MVLGLLLRALVHMLMRLKFWCRSSKTRTGDLITPAFVQSSKRLILRIC